jgi:hypothetical protein
MDPTEQENDFNDRKSLLCPDASPYSEWFLTAVHIGSRIVDEPAPARPNGAFAGQMRPNALLLDKPRGLLTPVYEAVLAPGLLTPFSQWGLFALNICTAPPRVEA